MLWCFFFRLFLSDPMSDQLSLSIIIILFMKYQMVNGQSISLIHLYWWSHQSSQFSFEIAIIAFVVGGGLQKTKLCNIGRSRNCWPLHALVLCLLRPLPFKCLSIALKFYFFPKNLHPSFSIWKVSYKMHENRWCLQSINFSVSATFPIALNNHLQE